MSWDLLSLSSHFEAPHRRAGGEAPAVAALRMLAGLEEIARESLKYRAIGSPKAEAPSLRPAPGARAPGGRIALPPAPPAPTLWSSRSKAYRPALGDPSVIEALLKFKDRAPPIEAPVMPRTPAAPARPQARPPEPVRPRAETEIQPARLERFSARDLEPCFPLAPSSNLLRPRQ